MVSRSGMNVSEAQLSRAPPDSIFLNFMNEWTDTEFGGWRHPGDTRGEGRRWGDVMIIVLGGDYV